jgi:hypothetical protein
MILKLETLRKADHKYLRSLKMCCWRRMEKIRNSEVLHTVKEEIISYIQYEGEMLTVWSHFA